MDESSVEEEIKSIESKIKPVEENLESVKSEIKSIKSMLGITSENVFGNTNHSQYDQLQNMLSSKENVMLTNENLLSQLYLQLNELYKLLLDMREEARGSPQRKRARRSKDEKHKQPSLGSTTPSNLTETKAGGMTVKGGIYCHWFALELYNLKKALESEPTTEELPLCEKSILIESSSVDRLINAYRSIVEMNAFPEARPGRGILCDTILQGEEVTATALLARELDRFLFSDTSKAHGACLHQLPVACENSQHIPERADFYIVELGTDGLPKRPIGVADYKNVDFRNACIESFGYSTRLMQKRCNDETFVAQLVFPASKDWIKLELHVGLSEKVLVIEISEVSLHSSEVEVGSFFRLLYAAVHFLLENPIKSQLPCCSPTRSLCLSMSDCLGSKKIPRVFVVDDKVYKLFDTDADSTNLSLVRQILDDEAECVHLSKDERFQYLRYRYREGDHRVKSIAQVILILRQLNKVHAAGFVHSDVRHTNIVFSYDGKHAWLIDFDLVAKEGTPYPATYNSFIKERHPSASPRQPRKKEHDCYSLGVILKRNGVRSEIVDQVKAGKDKLSEIAEQLSNSHTSLY